MAFRTWPLREACVSGLKGASEVDMNQVNQNKSSQCLRAKQPSRNINTARSNPKFVFSEWVVVGIAILALLAAEAMLCSTILGTNYYGVDGKMAQTTALAVFKFGVPFGINN